MSSPCGSICATSTGALRDGPAWMRRCYLGQCSPSESGADAFCTPWSKRCCTCLDSRLHLAQGNLVKARAVEPSGLRQRIVTLTVAECCSAPEDPITTSCSWRDCGATRNAPVDPQAESP